MKRIEPKGGKKKIKQPKEHKSIEELQKCLDEAIKKLDFVKAEEIQEEIKKANNEQTATENCTVIDDLIEQLNDVKTHYETNKETIINEFYKKELECRKEYDQLYEGTREKHLDEIEALKETEFEEYKQIITSKIPSVEILLQQAIRSARNEKYEQARRFQAEAKKKKEEETKKRKDAFEKIYKSKVQILLEHQRYEITLLIKEMEDALSVITSNRMKQINSAQQLYKRELTKRYSSIRTSYGIGRPSSSLQNRPTSRMSSKSSAGIGCDPEISKQLKKIYDEFVKGEFAANQAITQTRVSTRNSLRDSGKGSNCLSNSASNLHGKTVE